MASVRFYLKNPKAKLSAIYCFYDLRPGERFKFTLKDNKIAPSEWNKRNRRASSGLKHKKLNILIKKVIIHIEEIVMDYLISGEYLDRQKLKVELEIRMGLIKPLERNKIDFIAFVRSIMNRRDADPEFSKNTIKNYKTFIFNLEKYIIYLHTGKNISKKTAGYIEENKLSPLYCHEITVPWHRDWILYLYEYYSISVNTAATLTARLVTFLTLADDELESGNTSYKKINLSEKDTNKIYLNEKEILQIYNHDYELDYHRNAVNNYIIDCCLGLRYSDLKKFDLEKHIIEIDDKQYFKMTTQKSKSSVIIPLNSIVIDIYKNYDVHFISNVKLNKYIKEAAELAGVTQTTEKITYPAGKMLLEYVPKYKLITVHTARRSFATNMYLNNVPVRSIMMMTGHKTEKAFMRYLRINVEQNAQLVMAMLERGK